MLNFYSAHPKHTIINTARSFVDRVFNLTSRKHHKEMLAIASSILEKNNFPAKIVKKLIGEKHSQLNTTANRTTNTTLTNTNDATVLLNNNMPNTPDTIPQRYASVTYVPKLTEAIKTQVEYFAPHVKIAPRPPRKNARFFSNLKSRLPKEEKSGCVYKINCNDCDRVYIGETIQKLGSRLKQHKYDVEKSKKPSTALADHAKSNNHSFNFDDCNILCRERYKQRLRLQEINHIIANDSLTCNFKTDSSFVCPLYYSMLKSNAKRAASTCVPNHNNNTNGETS